MSFLNLFQLQDEFNLRWEARWEAISTVSVTSPHVLIRVYCGGWKGNQVVPFTTGFASSLSGLQELVKPKTIKIEQLYLDDLTREKMTMPGLIDWLLGSDIHIILTHVHQGMSTRNSLVDMNDMMQQLLRLRFHPGYPNGPSLYCPVFTQDKRRYLEALGDLANKTLFIDLTMPK